MTIPYSYASLTRIADFHDGDFSVTPLPRDEWADADYVVGEAVFGSRELFRLERTNGRMAEVAPGDIVVGALGHRAGTLEAVGSWQDMGPDNLMESMTSAGLYGRLTSRSPVLPSLPTYHYLGHVVIDGVKRSMQDYVPRLDPVEFAIPTILIIGTSMSAGKTTSGKAIVRVLKQHDLKVVGAKLTGAGRYRDILALQDAGADAILDFVDAGLPSSIAETAVYEHALETMLAMIAQEQPDVLVAEAGASPHEPYNGDAVVRMLGSAVECVVLAASDPYAVVGVTQAYHIEPAFVTGLATTTSAGRMLIERLTGLPSINVLEPDQSDELAQLLATNVSVMEGTATVV